MTLLTLAERDWQTMLAAGLTNMYCATALPPRLAGRDGELQGAQEDRIVPRSVVMLKKLDLQTSIDGLAVTNTRQDKPSWMACGMWHVG